MTTTTATVAEIKKFEVGKTYYDHSSCDYDTVFTYTIVGRTEKTATIENKFGEISKRKIFVDGNVETMLPQGNYSMAPVIRANRVLEEKKSVADSNAELIACIDDYAVDVDAAAEVEIENAEKAEISKVPKVDTQTNEKPTAKNFETIYLARTGAYTYKLENGEGLDDYYFKQKIHAAIKNGAKVKIRNGLTFYGWIDFSPCELQSVEVCDVYRMDELGDRIDKRIAAIIEYPNVAEKTLKEKVAEIKNRPHKSCIDWTDAVFQNVTMLEVFRLQREFKKLLKLGEFKRAAVVFENIQFYFRAA